MINVDSKTKKITVSAPEGEKQLFFEISMAIAHLRDYLYLTGKTDDEVNNICFAVFRIPMEDLKTFPMSQEIQRARFRTMTDD